MQRQRYVNKFASAFRQLGVCFSKCINECLQALILLMDLLCIKAAHLLSGRIKGKLWNEKKAKLIKDYWYPETSPVPRNKFGSSCARKSSFCAFSFTFFSLFLFFSSTQIIIQNLTTYSVYAVNVQAASLSAINPRRILLGLHSASRKVNVETMRLVWGRGRH